MFSLFRRKRSLGLDLGTHSLKWALLDRGRKEVVDSGQLALFPERSCLPQQLEWHMWEARVQQGLEAIPAAHSVYTVVQGKSTVNGYLEFPELAEDELKIAAMAEARQSIPFPADSIQFSYTKVPPLQKGLGVFYAAAVLGEVLRVRQLLERCGRAPQRVEIPALALAREFQINHCAPAEVFCVLLHLGFSRTHWVVVRNGHPYYARDFAFGMGEFVRAVQVENWADAEQSLASADFRSPRLAAPLRKLYQELQRTLRDCTERLQGKTLPLLLDVYLSGGGACANLAEVLGDQLRQRVLVDHWEHLKGPSQSAPLYKLAAGLAVQ